MICYELAVLQLFMYSFLSLIIQVASLSMCGGLEQKAVLGHYVDFVNLSKRH